MLIIGLTGSLGTGKSTAAKMLSRLGAAVIDADAITHELMRPGGNSVRAIAGHFGKDILKEGGIDRKKLGEIVFRDGRQLRNLCRIIHPAVIAEINRRLAVYKKENSNRIVVIDAPLLIEAGLDQLVDYVIVVKASLRQQLDRVVDRINISRAQALRRIRVQMPLKEKIQRADIIIDNRHTLMETKKQVKIIWEELLKKNQRI